jgi:trehalose utilization protein
MAKPIRVTIWNEFVHEKKNPEIAKIYPEGMHGAIAAYLRKQPGLEVRTATLEEPEHGLTDQVLAETDVLTWWGHVAHNQVEDEVVARAHKRVLEGMGLVVLHSGHFSKLFKLLMGTGCYLKWREAHEKARHWVVDPSHPIAEGVGDYLEIPHDEMYGEFFDIPAPEALLFIAWFPGGEVFRSGCCFSRGRGKIFYFQPGHETYPVYHDPGVLKVIANACRWAAQPGGSAPVQGHVKPLEKL